MKLVTILGASNQSMLTQNGMQPLTRVHLAKGTRVYAYGAGMCKQEFVVYDEKMNAVEIGKPEDVSEEVLDNYFSATKKLDDTVRPHSKKFGIGFYYDDEQTEPICEDVIRDSLERATRVQEFAERKEQRKMQEEESEHKKLIKDYKYLERCNWLDHKTCGRNIRTELKRNFPTTKFSVRYSSFSGGDEYSISWEDGPTEKQVDAIVGKYADKHPDPYSYGDYWDTEPSQFNHLFGGVSYVMTSRKISAEAIAKLSEEFEGLTDDNVTTYEYNDEVAYRSAHSCVGMSKTDVLRAVAHSRDLQEKPRKKRNVESPKPTQSEDGSVFNVVKYNDKCVVVVGDTRKIKDSLKEMGGRFNAKLTCGAGWVFPMKKREEVEEFINSLNM